jgi:hypothetical protein
MSTITVIMASVLTLEPPNPTPIPTKIDHVTVEQSSDVAHVLAYDSDGQVAGEIILSHEIGRDEMAELHIDAIFPDGAYMFAVVTDDGEQTVETEGNAAAQIAEIQAVLVEHEQTATWFDCGLAAALAAAGCIEINPFACGGGGIAAACLCLPKIVEEFEDMECFE